MCYLFCVISDLHTKLKWQPLFQETSDLFLKAVRAFFMGRNHTNNLRFPAAVAERPGPQANLPEGPSHKLSANYYYTRDGRREVAPPNVLADNSKDVKAIGAGESGAVASKVGKRPGRVFDSSGHNF